MGYKVEERHIVTASDATELYDLLGNVPSTMTVIGVQYSSMMVEGGGLSVTLTFADLPDPAPEPDPVVEPEPALPDASPEA